MSRRQNERPTLSAPGPPDDTGCGILHVDMDAFYASASLLARPELRGTPVIIGGGNRGVVLSASYEARAFGVEGGMSSTRARRLCPDAVAIAPDYDAYEAASEGVFAIFSTITPSVERVSLDEGFLDITGTRRLLGEPEQVGELIRALVVDEQGIDRPVARVPHGIPRKARNAEGHARRPVLTFRGDAASALVRPAGAVRRERTGEGSSHRAVTGFALDKSQITRHNRFIAGLPQ